MCYLFTKLLHPLVHYWCSKGIRITVYLDDGLAGVAGLQQVKDAISLVRETPASAGLIGHPEKSQWDPLQRLAWLGFTIDMAPGQIEVPAGKLTKLQGLTDQVLQCNRVPVILLASTVQKIISMSLEPWAQCADS